MKPIRALIVDDEQLARKRMRSMLDSRSDLQVLAECVNGKEAATAIKQLKPDLVFLDIQMPELDGFELIQSLDPSELPFIVFVTAFSEHAIQAFEINALDYLLKPFDVDRLTKSVERAKQQIHLGQSSDADFDQRMINVIDELKSSAYVERLALKSDGRVHLVPTDDIVWIEAAGNYVRIHLQSRQFLLRETMKSLEHRIDPTKFIRIHRSTIVNLKYVQSLEPTFHGDYQVMLTDGNSLPLSRKYRAIMRERFGNQI